MGVLGNYIGGQFVLPQDPVGQIQSKSPADWNDVVGEFPYSYRSIDEAVQFARDAFKGWRKTPFAQRAEKLRAYQAAIKRRENDLIQALAREVGKPIWESKTEVASMLNKVEITLTESMRYVADTEVPQILPRTLGATRYRPLGVMAVIGPFNFPAHLPNGHIIPALATGNTVIFKPSEKTPLVGQIVAECFHEAGFPVGVFNLVQGEREVGRRLCVHEGVNGVLFTGSYEVGTRIKQDTLQQHWKLLALEMGGKNPAIVWQDADLDSAVYDVLYSGFVTAGQRCSATSRVIVHSSLFSAFVEKLHARSKAFRIGHPLDEKEPPFMGPLIDETSVDRFIKYQGVASREGFELLMRGKQLDVPGRKGTYVTPSICIADRMTTDQVRKSVFQQSELFAPCLAVMPADEVGQAIELANATQFGLVTSVFTRSESVYREFWDGLEMGLVNWNKPTVGASSRLPFGGLKKSGNHFPTAVNATLYCTYPVASLEASESHLPEQALRFPGLQWE